MGRAHRVAGLFSGIGGLELGLEAAGHETVLACELDATARSVLQTKFQAYHGERSKRRLKFHDDVRTLDRLPSDASLVAAGFPCQDLSQAGRTQGIRGSRSGLVDEIFRLLKDRPVPWLLLENVPFMLRLDGGRAMEHIVSTLEGLGYKWAYRVVDTLAFGLPQRRLRVFIVAAQRGDPRSILFADDAGAKLHERPTDGASFGFYWTEGNRGLGWAVDAIPPLKAGSAVGVSSPPAIWVRGGGIGVPSLRDAERLQGFPAGWTRPAEEIDPRPGVRWRLVGNSVSVPVARWLGRRLVSPGRSLRVGTAVALRSSDAWPTSAWNVGAGRFRVSCSPWPVSARARPILEFLVDPLEPLSARATAGFLRRASASSLRKATKEFLDALQAHVETVRAGQMVSVVSTTGLQQR